MGSASAVSRRSGRSHLGGVPTTLPAPASPAGRQLAFPIEDAAVPIGRREVLPGAVHVSGWLDLAAQRRLADEFRRWALPPRGYGIHGCRPVT